MYNGKQARLVEQGFTVIHVYMGSQWEYNAVRRHLTKTRPKTSWMMPKFWAIGSLAPDTEIYPEWEIEPTSFDVFVQDEPEEVEAFIASLPQRTVEFPIRIKSPYDFECHYDLKSQEFAFLKRANLQIYSAEHIKTYQPHIMISAEDDSRALVELRLKIV